MSGTTRIVARLEHSGWVRRERDTVDGRRLIAVLTEAGFVELRRVWPAHLRGARRLIFAHLQGLTLDEVSARLVHMAERAARSA